MIVITDSSPLIFLARIGRLSLLEELYGTVYIPTAVHRETVVQDPLRPGAVEIASADWLTVRPVDDRLAARLLQQQIGPGESEAIILALQLKVNLLLIDDAKGRRIAEAYGIPAAGTIGVLIQAKRSGLLPAVKPSLDGLQAIGLHMDEKLYAYALQLCGENSGD
ncbi:MAG: DUF3368 domain-containing protein [Caldilineaceae bacterium]|nr:DUF3368 domain-containing protein [Caldilineaceae bacterium]